jgi:hypothetical protein
MAETSTNPINKVTNFFSNIATYVGKTVTNATSDLGKSSSVAKPLNTTQVVVGVETLPQPFLNNSYVGQKSVHTKSNSSMIDAIKSGENFLNRLFTSVLNDSDKNPKKGDELFHDFKDTKTLVHAEEGEPVKKGGKKRSKRAKKRRHKTRKNK